MGFQVVFPSNALSRGQVKVVKHDGQQVAVFRLDDGSLAAVDNRCPHEGYPLSQGSCSGGTLTCCYHNFKFDLTTGACLKGDEEVRVVPAREEADQVELDLTPPDPSIARAKAERGFRTARFEGRTGQALRDAARRLQLGADPWDLLGELAADDGARSEWGSMHSLAVCHDVGTLLHHWPDLDAVIPLSLPVEMVVRDHVRRPARPRAAPIPPPRDFTAQLAAAVESEDADRAEGLVRGALEAGWGRAELEPALMVPVAAHFLDFGHAAIYQSKVFDLLDHAGWHHGPDLLAGHVVGIVYGTREDVLPGWRRWRAQRDAASPRFPQWVHGTRDVDPDLGDRLAEMGATECVDAVIDALDTGASPHSVAAALIVAAAERLLRFDPAIDLRRDVQDSWLSVTHILTFTEAVHTLLGRWCEPETMSLLLMGARMVGHHRVLDGPRQPWTDRPWDPDAFRAALEKRDPTALDFVTDGLASDPSELQRLAVDHVLGEVFTRPIVVAHGLKLAVSGPTASRITDDPRPTLAALRPLVAPLQERRTRRQAEEAIALVRDGQVPRLLAP